MKHLHTAIVLSLTMWISACAVVPDPSDGAPDRSVNVSAVPNAVPKVEPRSKYGNPESYVVNGKRYHVRDSSKNFVQRGVASWYGTKFHGRRTSSGTPYNMYAMTAAHPTLPLPTYARVTNLRNGRSVTVRINDRGPFHDNRIVDLSYVAASKLGIVKKGTGLVELRAIDPGSPVSMAQKQPRPFSRTRPRLFLQVGSFGNPANAQRMRKNLLKYLNPTIEIVSRTLGQDRVFQVRIGPLRSVEEADHLTTYLHKFGVLAPLVVID